MVPTAQGDLSAHGGINGGNGGLIETSGHMVNFGNVQINASASLGKTGTWLIDPVDFTIAASGGNITGSTLSAALVAANVDILSSNGTVGTAGDINVNDSVSWSANQLKLITAHSINVNAVMNATGTGTLAFYTSTANGADALVAGGAVRFGMGADGGFLGRVDFGGRSGNGLFSLGGLDYTVIANLSQLSAISLDLAGRYVLGSDIDASSTASGAGFLPLGVFTGRFSGMGHTINDLYINRPSTNYIGLFSTIGGGGVVAGVGLVGGGVTGGYYVGHLAGVNNGTIVDSYASGSVTAQSSFSAWSLNQSSAGGLIGSNSGTISNSHATGSVTGFGMVGGLIGTNLGAITSSYATGFVTGLNNNLNSGIGGLVGYNHYSGCNPCSISDSYATGNVIGHNNVGGLVGWSGGAVTRSFATGDVSTYTGGWQTGGLVGYNRFGAITDSFATGTVQGATNAGGLIGQNEGPIIRSYATGAVTASSNAKGLIAANSGSITNSYWNMETSGQSSSNGGTGLTTAQFLLQPNFSGWNFSTTWQSDGTSSPFLRNLPNPYTINTWTGAADNVSWANAGNWSLGHAPTYLEKALIPDVVGTSWVSITGNTLARTVDASELIKISGTGTTAIFTNKAALTSGLELGVGATTI